MLEHLPLSHRRALKNAPKSTEHWLQALLKVYPDSPKTLLGFLKDKLDVTYHKEPHCALSLVPILGSDIAGLPNYLLSAEDILNEAKRNDECINEIYVDNRIDRSIRLSQRLYFAHCINNGGFSQLMIDFHPNTDGQVGQVIRFVHDPDEYRVIASSFDDYLQKLIEYECEHLKNIENYLD